ncbi:MAG: 2OG-Fe dioxygenase family protein, partial [Candidatus Dormibacteria bacterium]
MPQIAPSLLREALDVLRDQYFREKTLFLKGEQMAEILTGLGARESDLAAIQRSGDELPSDPTLPFRKSRNARFHLSPEQRKGHRTEAQSFVLSAEEDFVRHDSGMVRTFAEIPAEDGRNSVLTSLLVFQEYLTRGLSVSARPSLDYTTGDWISTVFHLRTITWSEILGQPALEGVHSDGVDHTMTVFLKSHNMTSDSAKTRVHHNDEQTGKSWDAVDPRFVITEVQHRDSLDTLLVFDHE